MIDMAGVTPTSAAAPAAPTPGLMSNYGAMPGYGYPGVDPNNPQAAAQLYGQMTQQQWMTYVQQYMPIENQLIAYASNTSLPRSNMQRAIGDVQTQQAQQPGVEARNLARYGINLRPDEAAAVKRDVGLSNSLAQVQAANNARDVTIDTQRSVLGAPMPNPSSGPVPGLGQGGQ